VQSNFRAKAFSAVSVCNLPVVGLQRNDSATADDRRGARDLAADTIRLAPVNIRHREKTQSGLPA
jgi:hypothetical protein